jgi:hypothetical protein
MTYSTSYCHVTYGSMECNKYVCMFKLTESRYTGHLVCKGKMININFSQKPKGNRRLQRLKYRWEDNIQVRRFKKRVLSMWAGVT